MARCFVGLGANQGHPDDSFERVIQSLDSVSDISLTSRSSNYRSRAMGSRAGDDFLNAVIELETSRSAFEIHTVLQSIEDSLGRLRGITWGPRVIDLDLLYVDDTCLESDVLTLPHPHAWYRRFVLEPMCEIAAEFHHPRYAFTQQQLLQRIDKTPFKLQILSDLPIADQFTPLQSAFPELEIEFVSDPDTTASLIIAQSGNFERSVPVVVLQQIPADNATEALRSVIAACLGPCVRLG